MLKVLSYKVTIKGKSTRFDWSGTFIEYPHVKDIEAAIHLDIEALRESDSDHDKAKSYTQLTEIVRLIAPISSLYEGSQVIEVAGTLIGTITIEHIPIFSSVSEPVDSAPEVYDPWAGERWPSEKIQKHWGF